MAPSKILYGECHEVPKETNSGDIVKQAEETIDGLCHLYGFPQDYPSFPEVLCALLGLARPSRSTHGFPALEKPRLRPRQDAHHWTGIHTFAARWELPSAPAARHAGREKGTKTT